MPKVFRESGSIVELGPDWLARLKAAALDDPLGRARICVHDSDEAAVHEMIIAFRQDVMFRPHRHHNKSESFHIIEGMIDIVVFSTTGEVERVVRLGIGKDRSFYYRLNTSLYHTIIPRTSIVVFHETTAGPFRSDETLYAEWAPEDPIALRRYLDRFATHEVRTETA